MSDSPPRYPYLGAGVGVRKDYLDDLVATERRLDWVEFITETFLTLGGHMRRVLDRCAERWPVIPHGVALGIGGPQPPHPDYVARLGGLLGRHDIPWFSDHLVYSHLGGLYTHELLPLPFRREVVDLVAARVRELQRQVERPMLLENPSYYAVMPGQELEEAEFITHILEEADCGLLLDVNNVFVNASNLGYDPRAFIEALPLERVGQLHLAGHHTEAVGEEDVIIDSHSTAVPDPVWDLFRYVLDRTGPVTTLVEWDLHIPPLDTVLDEADKARAVLQEYGG